MLLMAVETMAKGLGVGTAYLSLANIFMLAANYGIHIFSAKFLSPEAYGTFGLLMSLYVIKRSFLNIGIPRSVSKFMAESGDKTALIYKKSLRLQWAIAIIFCVLYIFLSPFIAGVLKDKSLQNYILFLGIMIVPLAIFAIYSSGYFNGSKLFKKQAYVKSLYEFLRVGLVFLLLLFGLKIWGILWGHFIATVIVAVACYYMWKKNGLPTINKSDSADKFEIRKIIYFSLPITISALAFTFIRNINTVFLKYFLNDNIAVGLYTAAMTISGITYFTFLSLPGALMPSISRSIARNDLALTRKYIQQSVRYLLLLLLPSTVLLAATSQGLLQLFYPDIYTAAALALSILVFSSLFLSVFQTAGSIFSGMGKPYLETGINITAFLFLLLLNILLIPSFGIDGAAIATLIVSILMVIAGSIYIYGKFKVIMSSFSFLRILFSSIIIFGLALWFDFSGWRMIAMYVILFLFYFSLLIFLGEIKKEDYQLVRKIIPFKF